jgi:signal transduction histidine kinase
LAAVNVAEALLKQPKALVWAGVVCIVLTVGYADFLTPYQLSMFVFYAFPIFFIGWYGGRNPAVALAAACAIISWFANLSTHPFHNWHGYAWSISNRLCAFLFVAFCGASMKSYREAARAQMDAIERTRQLEQEIVRTSEREQMRIGQDLHDGVCQNLAAIDCATECLRSELETNGISHAATARVIQNLLKETIVDARNLARGIFPVHMDAEGLSIALNDLVCTMNQLRQASITFEASDNIQIKDPSTAMHLYRIVQEALSNAMRHAQASNVSVRVVRNGYSLTITVSDDGCGFAAPELASAGMGLRTMRYRANLISAKLIVDTRPSDGTLVSCTIPVPPASGIWEKFDPTRSGIRSGIRPAQALANG